MQFYLKEIDMNAPVEKPVEILQYKTNVGYFAKVNTAYSYAIFGNYIVNGLTHDDAIKINGFAKLESEVVSVQQKIRATRKVLHYTLKDKELASNKLPLVVHQYWDDDEEETKLQGVEGYEALYEPVYEDTEEKLVDIPFVIINMGEYTVENPTNIGTRKIRSSSEGNYGNTKAVEEELSRVVIYDDIVKLLTPEFALEQAPCKLSSKQMYKITRQYLIENLDMKENSITSNYDFCFTVKKRVHTKPFVVTESYYQGKKLKSKQVTKNEKLVEVFEMTWAGYKGAGGYEGYTCIPELHGDNLEDLYNKLDTFLTSIVNTLNSVTTECECCGGTGHIVQTAKDVFKSILNK